MSRKALAFIIVFLTMTVVMKASCPSISVSLSPLTADVHLTATQQFTATVSGATNLSVNWYVNGLLGGNATVGTVSAAGLYMAPVALPSPASATVTAVSVQDTSKSGTATVFLSAVGGTVIARTAFGNHEHNAPSNGWPTVPVGTIRAWDSVNPQTDWNNIELTCNGTYTWTGLDSLVATAQSHGVDIVYTFGHYANQTMTGCGGATLYPATETSPPPDSPTDSKWAAFVTAITTRYAGKIKYWEISNEPNSGTQFFSGNDAQLVAMAAVAYPIIKASDPGAVVLTPSPQGPSVGTWFTGYFAAGGDAYADIVAFHGYMNPSHLNTLESTYGSEISGVKSAMVGTSLATAKIWDTEHGWGVDNPTTFPGSQTINTDDQDVQAAFAARHELFGFGNGIERMIWYAWSDDTHGTLYNKFNTTVLFGSCQPHTNCKAGVAYQQVESWLINGTYPVCTASGTQWTCTMTQSGGGAAQAMWDSSFTCSGGTCTTHLVTVSSSFTNYKDLAGNITAITSHQVPVGLKPILVY